MPCSVERLPLSWWFCAYQYFINTLLLTGFNGCQSKDSNVIKTARELNSICRLPQDGTGDTRNSGCPVPSSADTCQGLGPWQERGQWLEGEKEELEAGFNTSYSTLIPSSQAQVMLVSGERVMAWLRHTLKVSHRLQFKKAALWDLHNFRPSTTWHPVAGCIIIQKNYCNYSKLQSQPKPCLLE